MYGLPAIQVDCYPASLNEDQLVSYLKFYEIGADLLDNSADTGKSVIKSHKKREAVTLLENYLYRGPSS
jgi:hypothetical protein